MSNLQIVQQIKLISAFFFKSYANAILEINLIIIKLIDKMMFKTVLIFIIITPIVIISSTARKFDCPTANFDASVAINECFALLFNAKFMWLLDVCNFRLSTVYNFEPELLKCFHNDGHNGPNRQQQQQQSKQYENEQRQQLIAWNRFRKMKSTIMMYNNYPNSNFICMELVCMNFIFCL